MSEPHLNCTLTRAAIHCFGFYQYYPKRGSRGGAPFRLGCVYTGRRCCGSKHPHRGFRAAANAVPRIDIRGQGYTIPPSLEDGGQALHEVALVNFIHSITKLV
jgi:hypothetical protein